MQQAYAPVSGGGAINGWSYAYTGSGGVIKISVYISCYAAVVPQINLGLYGRLMIRFHQRLGIFI